jgi:hypothetical protein
MIDGMSYHLADSYGAISSRSIPTIRLRDALPSRKGGRLQVRGAQEHTCATIAWNQFLTTKMRRARREETLKRTREEIEQIAAQVVGAMLKVHRALGPGLLEKTYQVSGL